MLKASELLERNYHEGVLPRVTTKSGLRSYYYIPEACVLCQLAMPFCTREDLELNNLKEVMANIYKNISNILSENYGIPRKMCEVIEFMFEHGNKNTLEISQWLRERGY